MASGRIQQRIDPNLQEEAEAILKAQGIKPVQAITIFYTEIRRRRGFPFLPSEVPNEELASDLNEARKGHGVKTYPGKKEFFAHLKKL